MAVIKRPGHVLIGDCSSCGNNGLIMRRDEDPKHPRCLKCIEGGSGLGANSFRDVYKEQLEKFNNEVYILPLGDNEKLIDMAIDSFREELYTMPTEPRDLEILTVQFLVNELLSYEYITAEEYKDIEKKYYLDRLGRYF